jgi:hypothetical protein
VVLTAFSDDSYEEAALEGGAVHFTKSRCLSILVGRLRSIAEATRPVPKVERDPKAKARRLLSFQTCELTTSKTSCLGQTHQPTPLRFPSGTSTAAT